jgi:uncharacterized membrane protein YphA (DoxX/SURF4 family)
MTQLGSALVGGASAELFLLARLLFGGVIAFMGLNHFLNGEDMIAYARTKGLPAPSLAVYGSGAMLAFGGLSIALGAVPLLGAVALVVFFVVVTPTMHDFWNVDDPQQQQSELTDFLKNVALLGVSFGFLALSRASWPYALGVGLF